MSEAPEKKMTFSAERRAQLAPVIFSMVDATKPIEKFADESLIELGFSPDMEVPMPEPVMETPIDEAIIAEEVEEEITRDVEVVKADIQKVLDQEDVDKKVEKEGQELLDRYAEQKEESDQALKNGEDWLAENPLEIIEEEVEITVEESPIEELPVV